MWCFQLKSTRRSHYLADFFPSSLTPPTTRSQVGRGALRAAPWDRGNRHKKHGEWATEWHGQDAHPPTTTTQTSWSVQWERCLWSFGGRQRVHERHSLVHKRTQLFHLVRTHTMVTIASVAFVQQNPWLFPQPVRERMAHELFEHVNVTQTCEQELTVVYFGHSLPAARCGSQNSTIVVSMSISVRHLHTTRAFGVTRWLGACSSDEWQQTSTMTGPFATWTI